MSLFSKPSKPLSLTLLPLDNNSKPQWDQSRIEPLLALAQQNPTALFIEVEKYLQALNRFKLPPKQRFEELFHIVEQVYPSICLIKNKFLERQVPESLLRRNALQSAIQMTGQLIMGYKQVFQQDYDAPSNISRKAWLQRINSTGMYLLELIHLTQFLLAMRYQRLSPALWRDSNQILFALQGITELDTPHLRLHDTFAASTDSLCKTNTLQHIYILIQLFEVGGVVNWPCKHMGLFDRYLDRQKPALSLMPDTNPNQELAKHTLFISVTHSNSATRQRLNVADTADTLLLDIASLLKQIHQDCAQLSNANSDSRPKIGLLAHLGAESARLLLTKLAQQMGDHQRQHERTYVGRQPLVAVTSGWDNSHTMLLLQPPPPPQTAQSDSLLGQQAITNEWFLIDDSLGGCHFFTRETTHTPILKIGQLILYTTAVGTHPQLAKIERIVRVGETEIEAGLSKISGQPIATTLKGFNPTDANAECVAIVCTGETPQLLLPPTPPLSIGMAGLTVTINQQNKAFNLQTVYPSMAIFQHFAIELDFHTRGTTTVTADTSTRTGSSKTTKPSEDTSDLVIGQTLLNTYKIMALLGEGGMGKVYKIFHNGWNTELAVKTAKLDALEKAGGIDSFEKEAETWVNLGLHPHIVCCYYIRRANQVPLLFAEYIDGGSLKQWIVDKKLTTLEQILDIAIQFAWGLHHAHQHHLIHRDVKPANVMMTAQGIAKVTDFGLALTSKNADGHDTTAMTVIYCSPEQANQETLTLKTDMWSWGLSVLEMFKGEVTWPFGVMALAVLEGYLETEISERKNLPQMPRKLADLLYQCFQHKVEDRPKNMKVVADVLCQIYQEAVGIPYARIFPSMNLDTPDNLNNRAVSFLDLEKRQEAFKLWQLALQKQPNHLESQYNTGLLYWRQGQITDDALLMRLKGAQNSSAGRWVQSYLQGIVQLERDDCDSAESLWETLTPDALMRPEVQAVTAYTTQRVAYGHYRKLKHTFPTEHLGEISTLDSSKNARIIVSGSHDGHIRLWQADAKSTADYTPHQGKAVVSVRISRDGRLAVSGGADDSARQWEVQTGTLKFGVTHQHQVNCVRLSAEDQYALSAGDTHINVWQLDNTQIIARFDQHKSRVFTADFANNSRFVAAGDQTGHLYLWEIASGRLLRCIEAHEQAITALVWLPNNQHVLTASADTTIKLWDFKTGQCLHTYQGHSQAVSDLRLSADYQTFVSAGHDKTLRLWQIRSKQCLCSLASDEKINALCWGANADGVYTGGSQWIIKQWQILPQATPFHAPMMLSQIVNSEASLVALSQYEKALAQAQEALSYGRTGEALQHVAKARAQPGYGRSQEALKLWQELYLRFPIIGLNNVWQGASFTSKETITALCLSWKARYIVSATQTGYFQVWDLVKNDCVAQISAHQGRITALHISADNRFVLSAGRDNRIKLWDLKNSQLVHEFVGHEAPVTEVHFLNAEYFMSSSEDKTLKLWHIQQKRWVQTYAGHYNFINSFDLSLDNEFALSGGGGLSSQIDNTAKLWQVSTGRCLQTLRGHDNWISTLKISADGQFAVTGSHDRTVRIWKISTADCLHTLSAHDGPITAVDISQNGRYILSASKDKTVKLWSFDPLDIHNKSQKIECLHTFRGHDAGIVSACFSADGRYIISAGEDNRIQTWIMDWNLQERAMDSWNWLAKPWLEAFLNQQMPYALPLTAAVDPRFVSNMADYLSHKGLPTWSDADLGRLYYQLGCAGLGWLKPSGILAQLDAMLKQWQNTVSLVKEAFACEYCGAVYQQRPKCKSCGKELSGPARNRFVSG